MLRLRFGQTGLYNAPEQVITALRGVFLYNYTLCQGMLAFLCEIIRSQQECCGNSILINIRGYSARRI